MTTHFSLEQLDTPTGNVLIVCDQQDRLRAVDWEEHRDRMHRLLRLYYGSYTLTERSATDTSPACDGLRAYFAGDLEACTNVPIKTNGTEFQQAVWKALRDIPAGTTLSYGALAARIGRPRAARAVGLANGANPTPIVVPCHRVIGANASLTGFGGGLQRKSWLLSHEHAMCQSLRATAKAYSELA